MQHLLWGEKKPAENTGYEIKHTHHRKKEQGKCLEREKKVGQSIKT